VEELHKGDIGGMELQRWDELESRVKADFERRLAELEGVTDDKPAKQGQKQSIEAIAKGSAAAQAFAFDSAQSKQIDLAAKSLKETTGIHRLVASVDRKMDRDAEVAVGW
jgi:hypothetical protein